uniref:Alpha-1,2-Mannosidase n=1 Tax=Rhabditophanes sp. KR3021 TaxID=114890 RepID=A0AC35U1B8_9BILA
MWRSMHRLQKLAVLAVVALTLYIWTISYGSESLLKEQFRPEVEANKVSVPDFEDVEGVKVEEATGHKVTFNEPSNPKSKAVREAFKFAWKNYKKYAWGHDHLKPISKKSADWFSLGLTITDSIDTILIMNLAEEYEEAREYVKLSLSFNHDQKVNLFETSIRVLGGMLSAYHLTGDELYKEKATELGSKLLGAFEHSKTPIPLSDVNLKTKDAATPSWTPYSSLSEVTSLQLEFRDLSRVTGNATFEQITFKVNEHIHDLGCNDMDGLCQMYINPLTGIFAKDGAITLGARTDSFYEYLFKQWLQTGKSIDFLKEDYLKAVEAMKKHLLKRTKNKKLLYFGEMTSSKSFYPKMDHLVCFLAGTLALGSKNGFGEEHMELAKDLGETCYQFYNNPTGLGPEIAHFAIDGDEKNSDLYVKPLDAYSLLRPEAVEAWFYLFRLTGDTKYQEWGWKMFESIEKYAKVENGYSSVNNVKKIPVSYKDNMESFYLAETLKYLYLLLETDQTILPLDKWVFNTEAHPLPIYQH